MLGETINNNLLVELSGVRLPVISYDAARRPSIAATVVVCSGRDMLSIILLQTSTHEYLSMLLTMRLPQSLL